MTDSLITAKRLHDAATQARAAGDFLSEGIALRDALHAFVRHALGLHRQGTFPEPTHLVQAFRASDDDVRYGIAFTLARLAKACLDGGHPQLALHWCEVATRFFEHFQDADARAIEARLELVHAIALRRLNRYDEAEEMLNRCELLTSPDALQDRVAIALASCAILRRTGRRERAVARLRDLEQLVDAGDHPEMAAWVLANRAVIDDSLDGRFDSAVDRLLRARALLLPLGQSHGDRMSEIEFSLSQCAFMAGDPRAFEFAVRALARDAAHPRADNGWRALEAAAIASSRTSDPWLTTLLLKRAVDRIESMRSERAEVDFDLEILSQHGPAWVYDTLAQVLVRHGRPGEARAVLERKMAKAVAQAPIEPLSLTPEEDQATAEIDRALADQAQRYDPQALARELASISARLEATRESIDRQVQALNEQLARARLARLPPECRADTLVFHVIQDVRTLTVRASLEGRELLSDGTQDLQVSAQDVHQLAFGFTQGILQGRSADLRRLGRELHRLFIEPLEGLVPPTVRRLLVCAPSALHALPWAALCDTEGRFLVERFDLVRGTLPQTDLKRRPRSPMKVLACASRGGVGGHAPLDRASEEVQRLNAEHVYAGPGAFTLNALKAALPHFSVLHVASHFFSHPTDLSRSRLLLGDDSEISLQQLIDMGVHHLDMLVLSACESGVTGGLGGADDFAIDHALQACRVPAIISTLFPVGDSAMADFMPRLHAHLRQGQDKARALGEVQRAFIRGELGPDGRDPFFWAAPVLSGNWLGWLR